VGQKISIIFTKGTNMQTEETSRYCRIIEVSNDLFANQGYYNTSIRQIAKEANISLGLIRYHFDSKRELANIFWESQFKLLESVLNDYINSNDDPLLYLASFIKLSINFFYHKYNRFYIESHKEDIYSDVVCNFNVIIPQKVKEKYNLDVTNDFLMLFGNYTVVNTEKILVLNKEKGLFKSIDYNEIPDLVFKNSMEKFIDDKLLSAEICRKSKIIVDDIMKNDLLSKNIKANMPSLILPDIKKDAN